jgi:hypothetical protein
MFKTSETERARKARCRAKNKKRYNTYNRHTRAAQRAADPEKFRAHQWKLKGMPTPTRPRPEACECCGKPPAGKLALALDHDHETNVFRGWLCANCNVGIGKLGDNIAGVLRAISYINRSK